VAFTVHEASARILDGIRALEREQVPLRDAFGRVLAEDVVSPIDHPPWDNSSMDGYAVRAADVAFATESDPVTLFVLETVRAGQRPSQPVAPRTAIRIMTGAPVPDGADTVIRVEDTDGGEKKVTIRDARDAGRNVRPRGEDFRAGDVVLPRGTVVGAAHLGVLASMAVALIHINQPTRH
jgi:molybdopterin molybdotransferase